jgi:hypothetical protein
MDLEGGVQRKLALFERRMRVRAEGSEKTRRAARAPTADFLAHAPTTFLFPLLSPFLVNYLCYFIVSASLRTRRLLVYPARRPSGSPPSWVFREDSRSAHLNLGGAIAFLAVTPQRDRARIKARGQTPLLHTAAREAAGDEQGKSAAPGAWRSSACAIRVVSRVSRRKLPRLCPSCADVRASCVRAGGAVVVRTGTPMGLLLAGTGSTPPTVASFRSTGAARGSPGHFAPAMRARRVWAPHGRGHGAGRNKRGERGVGKGMDGEGGVREGGKVGREV